VGGGRIGEGRRCFKDGPNIKRKTIGEKGVCSSQGEHLGVVPENSKIRNRVERWARGCGKKESVPVHSKKEKRKHSGGGRSKIPEADE